MDVPSIVLLGLCFALSLAYAVLAAYDTRPHTLARFARYGQSAILLGVGVVCFVALGTVQ